MGRTANKPEDVWKYIDKRGEDECWPWLGGSQKGYGVFSIKHKNYRVTRIVCWLRDPSSISIRAEPNGSDRRIPLHSCDHPICCNPAHLSVGLPKDNTQDMISKGRRADFDGEKGQRSKLTNADVARIREARLFGASLADLANVYGVAQSTISMAARGLYYRSAA